MVDEWFTGTDLSLQRNKCAILRDGGHATFMGWENTGGAQILLADNLLGKVHTSARMILVAQGVSIQDKITILCAYLVSEVNYGPFVDENGTKEAYRDIGKAIIDTIAGITGLPQERTQHIALARHPAGGPGLAFPEHHHSRCKDYTPQMLLADTDKPTAALPGHRRVGRGPMGPDIRTRDDRALDVAIVAAPAMEAEYKNQPTKYSDLYREVHPIIVSDDYLIHRESLFQVLHSDSAVAYFVRNTVYALDSASRLAHNRYDRRIREFLAQQRKLVPTTFQATALTDEADAHNVNRGKFSRCSGRPSSPGWPDVGPYVAEHPA